jgi:hypothetical protein
MGILLTFIAGFGLWLLTPFFLLYSLLKYRSFKDMNNHWMKIAISLDQLGNVVGKHALNDTLVKGHGYEFGHEDDTISEVLGKNKRLGDLTKAGMFLCNQLNKIDENHVEDAADSD